MNYYILLLFAFYLFANCQISPGLFILQKQWTLHKKEYNLFFHHKEEAMRMHNFGKNLEYIEQHNNGNHGFLLGMNRFGHWSRAEYLEYIRAGSERSTESETNIKHKIANLNFPDIKNRDWNKLGAVTSVKNQGNCGSCWAFAATGVVEGMHQIKHKKLIEMSTQDILDCSYDQHGCQGCEGGFREGGLQSVVEHGINAEVDYKYEEQDGNCRHNNSRVVAQLKEIIFVSKNNETALSLAISNIGPISVGIDASDDAFRLYKSGIYKTINCSKSLNHGVLAVGVHLNPDYYLIKNSWGVEWGEDGYIRFARNNKNQCGIAVKAVYGTAK